MTTRIYRVDDGRSDRLIRASSRAQAVAHIAQSFAVRVASQTDLENLFSEGIKVETAGEQPVKPDTAQP